MKYLGDYTLGKPIYGKFNTQGTGNAPINLVGSPAGAALAVYKDNSLITTFTGVTLTTGFNGILGLNHFAVETTGNSFFYTTGSQYSVIVATGTVDGISVVGKEIANFSISRVSALQPTIPDNRAFTSASGTIGINLASVENQSSSVVLSNTTVNTATNLTNVSAGAIIPLSFTSGALDAIGTGVLLYNKVEPSYTTRDVLRLILSSAAGQLSGASGAGSTIYIRDIGNTKNRIVAIVNSSGDRINVSTDIS